MRACLESDTMSAQALDDVIRVYLAKVTVT